jgi:GNAT superfamily N-acetyltransferase
MLPRPIRHRRARRADFPALTALLAAADVATIADDRRSRSRFRRVVADLGADLYVATIDEVLCGVVHVTYSRQLVGDPAATVELLAVAPTARHLGVGAALLGLSVARARGRACRVLSVRAPVPPDAAGFFSHLGWRDAGAQLVFDVTAGTD